MWKSKREKVLLFICAVTIAMLLAVIARADDGGFTIIESRATPRHLEALRDHERYLERDRCFPYGCGGISGPITNPAPRTEAEKPQCYYDAEGKLFYEKDGASCPYMYTTNQAVRIEQRKQEWLKGE